jgi:hypothetical protein
MNELQIPDLAFPMARYGRHAIPWDFRPLLYPGGAEADRRSVNTLISQGELGQPLRERLPLVCGLHDSVASALLGGGSQSTAQRHVIEVRRFYKWIDASGRSPNLDSILQCFLDWAEHLYHRQQVTGDIEPLSVYVTVSTVAALLDSVLNLKSGLLHKTRIRKRTATKRRLGTQTDKENLNETFRFGHALLDICDALSADSIRGKLPISIQFRDGQLIEEWSGLQPPSALKSFTNRVKHHSCTVQTIKNRAAWEADTSLRTRSTVVNLRIQAELLIFIAQTGMNLAQAYKLRVGCFSYRSHIDGYEVRRIYKNRRRGEVEFQIYTAYRPLFERYLKWRHELFPGEEDGLLFPLRSKQGRSENIAPEFGAIEKKCIQLNIKYAGPRLLRKTRQNWLLRHSKDPDVTAEMGQHAKETLLNVYCKPNHQIAVAEISQFHLFGDPAITPPGPGICVDLRVTPLQDNPPEAPRPDCQNPAGCLFCVHQRDIDSSDYMWSLASYGNFQASCRLNVAFMRLS